LPPNNRTVDEALLLKLGHSVVHQNIVDLPTSSFSISKFMALATSKAEKPEKTEKAERSGDPATEKAKALALTLEKLDKAFGKGTVMKLSDQKIGDIAAISTGSLSLDIALGIGGLPKGRIVEIYGPESSGKTTLTLHAIAEAQKAGGVAAFIDAEHAFDPIYAQKLGIDTSNLLIAQPDNGEQALEIADQLISSGAIDICVIDSVAALVPKGELEGDMGDSKVGLHARLMSQALRKLTGTINKTGCLCIFINQLREKIGVMFGSPETTTGGNALKFYASVRLDIRRIGQIKEDKDNVTGNRTKVKVVKNKVAPPFKVVEFDIIYGEGISKVGEILDLGVDMGIIAKSGSWFSYNGNRVGQGRDAVKTMLLDNPEMADEIEAKIRSMAKGDTEVIPVDLSGPEDGEDTL
jgi:recombination protein RecA